MTELDEMARLWRKLSACQRLYLVDPSNGWKVHSITTGRSLVRAGLLHGTRLTIKGSALQAWARDHGYAQYDGSAWTFSEPGIRRERIDPEQLKSLANDGLWKAAIAEQLGVSREAVRQAAIKHSVNVPGKPKKPAAPRKPPTQPRTEHVNFAVTTEELARIRQAAAQRGLRVSSYLRELCTASTDDEPKTTGRSLS